MKLVCASLGLWRLVVTHSGSTSVHCRLWRQTDKPVTSVWGHYVTSCSWLLPSSCRPQGFSDFFLLLLSFWDIFPSSRFSLLPYSCSNEYHQRKNSVERKLRPISVHVAKIQPTETPTFSFQRLVVFSDFLSRWCLRFSLVLGWLLSL